MYEERSTYDDEIDLVQLFQTLWDGKWKIIGIVIFSVLSVLGYQFVQPQTNFVAKTEIKPIASFDAERYRQSNSLGFFEVTPDMLLNLYIEKIDERTLFEDAIRKYQLLDIEKFEDKEAYEEAVIALASTIQILPPINVNGTDRGEVRRFWTIQFEHIDKEKWIQILSSVDSFANQAVKSNLQQGFKTSLYIGKQKSKYELEDIQTQIENALVDYERTASDRLAFLREQASVARKLEVAKNTIEAQTFSAQNGMVASVKTDNPFYLRGYEAIEKEIELIETREDIKAFIPGLLELEQKKRSFEQDKIFERADSLFATTPIMNTDEFSATSVTIGATEFESQHKRIMMLVMAVVVGGIVGAIYVLISDAISKRKERLSKA